jgi:formate dehydrogenase alpha subunit
MTNSMSEIEDADCIFIIGSNTTSSHPLVATRVYRAKEKGASLIVADPRRIQIASKADIAVRHNLGSDVALLNGMMRVILENGWQDQSFIDERTEGFAEFKESVLSVPLDKAAEVSGVPVETIEAMARAYAQAEKATILYCMGITQHTTGVDNVKSLANLAMLTGNLGRESTGVNPLRGQNNVQGACDMGGLPNVFPAYQPVTSPEAQEKMNAAWKGVKIPGSVGLALPEMLKGAEDGTVKAFFVLGENPVLSDPDSDHVRKALKNLDFLVVQDLFLTETAEMADVVLPGASFAEKDGTFTNTERRVMRVRKAIEPVGESRADWEIIQDLATRFGYPLSYASPAEIMDEIATVTPSYAGISYDRLEGPGLQWPCPSPEHPGTPILHQGRFTRGKGLFHAIDYRPPAEVVDEEYPLWLTTGRVFAHYHTGSMTRNSPSLEGEISEGFLEVHPQDADKLGIGSGQRVYVSSRRGRIAVRTVLTENIRPGVVFMPFHFVESCANILTNPAMDPIAKIPEYKVCAVNLEKVA